MTEVIPCPECPGFVSVDPQTGIYESIHGHSGRLPPDSAEPPPSFHSAHIGETFGQNETPPEQIQVGKQSEREDTLNLGEGGSEAGKILSAQRSYPIGQKESLPFQTARELAAEAPAEVDWIARPWVAAGAVTELTGKVKAAGKTTWALALCRAVRA